MIQFCIVNVILLIANLPFLSLHTDYAINILIPKFVDLRDVPFQVYSCGKCCNVIKDRLSTQQKQLVRELDEEYEANLREAQRLAGVDIKTSSVSSRGTNNRRRNRTKKCVIM